RLVRRRRESCAVPELVKGPFVFRVRLIHPMGVLDSIIVHDREAVDIGVFGDGAGFRRTDTGLGVGCRETECREQSNSADKASSCNGFHGSTFRFVRLELADISSGRIKPSLCRAAAKCLRPVAEPKAAQTSASTSASPDRSRLWARATNSIPCRHRVIYSGCTASTNRRRSFSCPAAS